MRASIILTTYNQPDWLEKTLWGYAVQTVKDFEIVITDDGSGPPTFERIEYLRKETGLEIVHVWQEDKGFRKCTAQNRAITASRAEYLIFTDGDCIPRRDFVEAHLRFARPGRYLSGGYYKLPLEPSKAITPDEIRSNAIFNARWLLNAGVPFHPRMLKFHLSERTAALCCRFTTTPATFNGMSSSAWREDAVRINGFDERMQYGGSDREFGLRLENAGVQPIQIRYHALCLHLDHGRKYNTRESFDYNYRIRRETRKTGCTWTPYGIEQERVEL
ncbi:MAG: glycosyltransferase [Armatimonadota bacterium]